MQVNSINNQTSFTSKGSLKGMLKLPETNQVAKDINKLTSSLVNFAYKNKAMGDCSFIQNNRTALDKAKVELGEYLSVDPKIEPEIKDETVKIPFRDVVKLLDIVSANMKKPISKLIPKLDKIPTISKALDDIKYLEFLNSNPEVTFSSIFRMVSGLPVEKSATLIPLRQAIKNTNESAAEAINPAKKELAENLEEMAKDETYSTVKNEVINLFKLLKNTKSQEDLIKIVEQIQKIMTIFN